MGVYTIEIVFILCNIIWRVYVVNKLFSRNYVLLDSIPLNYRFYFRYPHIGVVMEERDVLLEKLKIIGESINAIKEILDNHALPPRDKIEGVAFLARKMLDDIKKDK